MNSPAFAKHLNRTCGAAILLMAILAGCAAPTVNPTREFLINARDETSAITSTKDRFRRQLNVADAQIWNDQRQEARQTLALAEATLQSAKPGELDERMTLAGWVSLAELYDGSVDYYARQTPAEQFIPAMSALDKAVELLHQIKPEYMRTYYVRSIAREIERLHDRGQAAAALAEAGTWADQIQNQRERRRAYRGLASDLLADRDYNAATEMLKRDPDPVWRTDAAVAITSRDRHVYLQAGVPELSKIPYLNRLNSNSPATQPDQSDGDFGIPLDYQSNFSQDQPQEGQSSRQESH